MPFFLLLVLCAFFLSACTDPDPLLARFDQGYVRESDLAREIRFLHPSEKRYRDHVQMTTERRWADWTRRIALREIGLHLAEQQTITTDPRLREQARRAAREWLLQQWEQVCYGLPLSIPSDEELTKEVSGQVVHLPSRIRVSHIFLRTRTPEEDTEAQRQLTGWRAEIATKGGTAEIFQDYARRYSHSQTARKDGRLGWVHEGWLPKAAEEVLYTLASGTMSQPIQLRGGWHLFFVEENSPAHSVPLDQKVAKLRAQRTTEAKHGCRRQVLATAQVLHTTTGDPEWPNLRVGSWSIAGQLLRELYGEPGVTPEPTRIRYIENETLYQTALASSWPDAATRRRVEDLQRDVWLNAIVQQRVVARLKEPTAQELRAAYAQHGVTMRTRRALQLRILKTTIPAPKDPLIFLDTLTTFASGLRSGSLTWEQIGGQLGGQGTIEAWPMHDVWTLAEQLSPTLLQTLANVSSGSIIGPIQDGTDFYILHIEAETPARPLTFDEALPQLRAILMRERGKEVAAQVVTELLEAAHFQLTPYGQTKTKDGGPTYGAVDP